MPEKNMHFPKFDVSDYVDSWDAGVRCSVMQGGQGDIKHWAFNDPVKRGGKYKNAQMTPAEYPKLSIRVANLYPVTIMGNARTRGGGVVD